MSDSKPDSLVRYISDEKKNITNNLGFLMGNEIKEKYDFQTS